MQFNTKYDVKQRVYTDGRDRVLSGLVATIHCKADRLGNTVSYDVWIDNDEKCGYGYWLSADENKLFPTQKEAEADMKANRELGGKDTGKV